MPAVALLRIEREARRRFLSIEHLASTENIGPIWISTYPSLRKETRFQRFFFPDKNSVFPTKTLFNGKLSRELTNSRSHSSPFARDESENWVWMKDDSSLFLLRVFSSSHRAAKPGLSPAYAKGKRNQWMKWFFSPKKYFKIPWIFLDASSHLYMRSCPSVRPSVGPSVGPCVTCFF